VTTPSYTMNQLVNMPTKLMKEHFETVRACVYSPSSLPIDSPQSAPSTLNWSIRSK
jgi:hypothetical protein